MTEENEYFEKLDINQRMKYFLHLINKEVTKEELIHKLYKIKPYDYIIKDGIDVFIKKFPYFEETDKFVPIMVKLYKFYKKNGINSDIDKINVTFVQLYFESVEHYEKCNILKKLLIN